MIIQLPFSGFYESMHNSQIDYQLYEQTFTDYETGCINNSKLSDLAYDAMKWNELFVDYSKQYAEYFADKFQLKLEFESLSSPKQYNFSTDRIFCTIDDNEVIKLWHNVSRDNLIAKAKEMFTSQSGFISFYSSDFSSWGDVLTWDCNQLHCLLMAWLETNHDFDSHDFEWGFIDSSSENDLFQELIFTHCPMANRLYAINDYLNQRIARA